MKVLRSVYVDCSEKPRDCDIVQLKHDGHFAFIVIRGGVAYHFSRSGRLVREFALLLCDCIVLGEYITGTERSLSHPNRGKVGLFDCLEVGPDSYFSEPYETRKELADAIVESYPETFFKINQRSSSDWDELVEQNGEEGLIYRRSGDDFDAGEVFRHKKTEDVLLSVVDFTFSDSELYGGLVKSIVGEAADGSRTLVPGLSQALRVELTCSPELFRGRKFEAICSGRFKSGKLRHPRFKRWEGETE